MWEILLSICVDVILEEFISFPNVLVSGCKSNIPPIKILKWRKKKKLKIIIIDWNRKWKLKILNRGFEEIANFIANGEWWCQLFSIFRNLCVHTKEAKKIYLIFFTSCSTARYNTHKDKWKVFGWKIKFIWFCDWILNIGNPWKNKCYPLSGHSCRSL